MNSVVWLIVKASKSSSSQTKISEPALFVRFFKTSFSAATEVFREPFSVSQLFSELVLFMSALHLSNDESKKHVFHFIIIMIIKILIKNINNTFKTELSAEGPGKFSVSQVRCVKVQFSNKFTVCAKAG